MLPTPFEICPAPAQCCGDIGPPAAGAQGEVTAEPTGNALKTLCSGSIWPPVYTDGPGCGGSCCIDRGVTAGAAPRPAPAVTPRSMQQLQVVELQQAAPALAAASAVALPSFHARALRQPGCAVAAPPRDRQPAVAADASLAASVHRTLCPLQNRSSMPVPRADVLQCSIRLRRHDRWRPIQMRAQRLCLAA